MSDTDVWVVIAVVVFVLRFAYLLGRERAERRRARYDQRRIRDSRADYRKKK